MHADTWKKLRRHGSLYACNALRNNIRLVSSRLAGMIDCRCSLNPARTISSDLLCLGLRMEMGCLLLVHSWSHRNLWVFISADVRVVCERFRLGLPCNLTSHNNSKTGILLASIQNSLNDSLHLQRVFPSIFKIWSEQAHGFGHGFFPVDGLDDLLCSLTRREFARQVYRA